ncbi:unnamed protein product [Miscanthus lutarioriparius]|uniref:Uncharacterized protein n=1 Tax=Miscanthus lutarioriparius TaxID=422564 RepID=A0A811REB7_9POAL|nr:unnamed protein product [Miscanthus lutarioriparius]
MARAAASRLAAAANSSSTRELFARHLAGAAASAWTAPPRLPEPGRERRSPSWWCPSRSFHATRRVYARDFYDVLGVSKDASAPDIKKSYYALIVALSSLLWTPMAAPTDVSGDMIRSSQRSSILILIKMMLMQKKIFQEVNRAYEVLKDDDKREIYDQLGPEAYERQASGGDPGGPGFPQGNPFGDIFGDIFDNAYRGGQDVKVSVELSFMEAVQGCRKTITYEADTFCGTCNGSGVPPGTVPKTCKTCRGSGVIYMQKGIFTVECTCSLCSGSGKIVKSFCKTCKGEQVVKGKMSVKLDIAAGIDDNDTMKVFGKGGADVERNKPGDLYVTIKVREDPIFRREGNHVHVDSVLSIAQAVLGGTVTVPTLTGNVTVKVRQGTQPGEKVVLRGKGIKARNSSVFGNQYVHFNIRVPTEVTQRQRELIEEFDKEECTDRERLAAASG